MFRGRTCEMILAEHRNICYHFISKDKILITVKQLAEDKSSEMDLPLNSIKSSDGKKS
jgi:hypothetical protein